MATTYNPFSGVPLMYQTGGVQGGGPTTGSGTPYGMVPNLPPYTTDTTQQIGTNAYPQLAAILGAGYQGGLTQEMGNIGSLLKGQIPSDVLSQLYQSGAERGVAMGSPGSPNANAAMMRALGLTSLGLQEQGIGDLTKVIGQVPIQPSQTTTQTTDLGAARAGYAAAPDPNLAAQQALKNAMAGIGAGRGSVGAPGGAGAPSGVTPFDATSNVAGADQYFANLLRSGGLGALSPSTYTPPATQAWQPYTPLGTTALTGSFGAQMGAQSLYPASQYGLPTWADTGSMMGFDLPGYDQTWGNQPVSSGQMYLGDTSGYGGADYGMGGGTTYMGGGNEDQDWWNYLMGGTDIGYDTGAGFDTGDYGYDDSWLFGDLGYEY